MNLDSTISPLAQLSWRLSRRRALASAAAATLGLRASTALGQSPTANQEGATLVPAEAELGGRLRIAFEGSGATENLLPIAFTAIDYFRLSQICEPLARFSGAGQELVLATAMEPNEDNTVWTISLQPGVTWHDGSPFTANDVLFSFNLYADPSTGGLYIPLVGAIDLPNADAVDDLTVRFPLLTPLNDLDLLIGGGELLIFKDGWNDPGTMIGTGPFQLTSFTPGESTLLTRYDGYWGAPERGPYLDEIEILSIAGASARANAVESGQADLAPSIGYADAIRLQEASGVEVLVSQEPQVTANSFSMYIPDGPFADIRLRDAVKLGTNRQELIDLVFLGFGIVGNDLFGLGQEDYNGSIEQRPFDPDTARALVAEAGADGLEFPFVVPQGYPGSVEAATVLVEQLQAIGLQPQLETVPLDVYSGIALEEGPPAPLRFGMGQGYLLQTTWQFNYSPGSPVNFTGWNDPEWLAQFALSQSTSSAEERTAILDELQQQLWAEGGDLIWGYSQSLAAATPNLRNVSASYYPILNLAFLAS